MFSSVRFDSVAERGENGLSFIPVGKLVGIVAAARLPGLSRGYQENRFIPVCGVSHKAHRGPMSPCGRTHAINRPRLGLVRDAQKTLQKAFTPDSVKHAQGVEIFPGPNLHPLTLSLLV